jgi:hypothetical protein
VQAARTINLTSEKDLIIWKLSRPGVSFRVVLPYPSAMGLLDAVKTMIRHSDADLGSDQVITPARATISQRPSPLKSLCHTSACTAQDYQQGGMSSKEVPIRSLTSHTKMVDAES